MVRYHVVASGRVQGVGFRYFVHRSAAKFPLTGFVRNLSDGTVEMELQGELIDIKRLLLLVKDGNYIIKVKNLATLELPLIEEQGFIIKY